MAEMTCAAQQMTLLCFEQWEGKGEAFERWKEGATGQPLVDANMRELKATGFMSNRGRQNVASYLTQVSRVIDAPFPRTVVK